MMKRHSKKKTWARSAFQAGKLLHNGLKVCDLVKERRAPNSEFYRPCIFHL